MTNLALDLQSSEPTISNVVLWREQLTDKLKDFVKAFNDYHNSIKTLSNFLDDTPRTLNEVNAIEEVINNWIDGKCEDATNNANNVGHLKITRDRLPSDAGNFSFPYYLGLYDRHPKHNASAEELVSYAFKIINFEELEVALAKEAMEIENSSFKDAANKLGSMFDLAFRHSHNNNVLQVKRQKGRFIVEVSHYGSWSHDRIGRLESVLDATSTFENETGSSGLRDCLLAAIGEERNISGCHDCYVTSRTKVNIGESVEAIYFKDKIKFHFKPEQFESLVGFVQSYTDYTIKTIEVK